MIVKHNTINCASLFALTWHKYVNTCQFTLNSDRWMRCRKGKTSHSDEKRKEEIASGTVKIEEICNGHHHHESREITGFREGKIVKGGMFEDR